MEGEDNKDGIKDCDAIRNVPYFEGLKDEIICSILEYTYKKCLKKGEYLFYYDDICNHLYIIKEGIIEIFQIGEDGKKIILHHAGRGAVLGDTMLFSEGRFEAHGQALIDTEVLMIRKEHFEDLIYTYPEISIRMLMEFGKRIKSSKGLHLNLSSVISVRGL